MNGYLLDTNAPSEVLRRRPSEKVAARLREIPATALATSSICVMELRFGAARLPGDAGLWHRARGMSWRSSASFPLGLTKPCVPRGLLADLEARGEPIGMEDVLIAATAQVHDLVVVTRSERHFGRVQGLIVENWWTG